MKPILFSSEMVRAILEGRKTQTRRVVKPQPEKCGDGWIYNNVHFADDAQMQSHLFHDIYGNYKCPYGGVYSDGTGDTLWVRETWASHKYMDDTKPSEFTVGAQMLPVWYRADNVQNDERGRWRPSIFMPRWASRITLRVVDVRVERVQDISDEDCINEGMWMYSPNNVGPAPEILSRGDFAELWDFINARRGHAWDTNPWVWVVEFEEVS